MAKPTIQLHDLPDNWFDSAASQPASDTSGQSPGILGGLPMPREWSLADSSLNLVVPPEVMKTIDFSGNAPPELPPWLDSGNPMSGNAAPLTVGNGWVQLPRPTEMEAGEHGSGYYTYGTDQTARPGTAPNGQWGTPRTIEVIGAVADQLATGDRHTPFGVGNISLAEGGKFPGHGGHKDGLDIDLRPARTDSGQLPVTYQSPQYDRAATQRLVDTFHATGQVDKIFFNDPLVRGVQPLQGHDNHFHIKIKR